MTYGFHLGVVSIIVLLALSFAAAQDEDAKALIEFVEQGLKKQTLVQAIETFVAQQDGTEVAESAKVVGQLNSLTIRLYRAEAYQIGLALAQRVLNHAEKKLGQDHPGTLTSVNYLAGLYEIQGRYGEAEPLYKQVLEGYERTLGQDHPRTLTSVSNLAALYEIQGRYGEAEPLFKRALEGRERALGQGHPRTFKSVNNLALLYSRQGRYGEAEPLFKRVLEGRERVSGQDHPDTLTIVNNLAMLYLSQGRYGEAEPLFKRALEGRERVSGHGHPQTLGSINNLALLYESQGRYSEAEPLFKRVFEGNEQVLGQDHPNTLISGNNLAALYESQGRYSEAEPLFKRVFEGHEQVLGQDHPHTLGSVNNLAGLYESQGRYSEAEPLFKRALEGNERVLGQDHPNTLGSVNNLAGLYKSQGRYGEAEPLYKRALEGRERVLGRDHPETLTSVNNLAGLYSRQDRYGEAEPLYKRALEVEERVLGQDHPRTLTSVDNLALLYSRQDRYGEAESLYKRALEGRERVLGQNHLSTLASVNNLAVLYESQGRYGEAEPLYKRALEGIERGLGQGHPRTLTSVSNLAALYESQGRYDEAESLYQQVFEGNDRVFGESHPHTLNVLMNYTGLLVNLKKIDAAFETLKTFEQRLFTYAAIQLQTTTQQFVKRQFLFEKSIFQDIVMTLAAQHPSADFAKYAAGVLLRWKRLQGDEDAYLARLVRTSDSHQIRELGQDIIELRSELSRLLNAPEADSSQSRSLLERLETKELQLSRLSRHYKQHLASHALRADDVRASLPTRSALIEFKRYRPANFQSRQLGGAHFIALFLPGESLDNQELQLIDLGPVSDIAKLWLDLRQGFEQKKQYQRFWHLDLGAVSNSLSIWQAFRQRWERDTPHQFYQKLFGKLAPHMQSFDTLYIALDGFLHLVALSRLVLPNGRYWFEHHDIRQIHTGRDLIPNENDIQPQGVVALGGINYDHYGVAKPSPIPFPKIAMNSQSRSWRRDLTQYFSKFKGLQQSGGEVSELAAYFGDDAGTKPIVWLGAEASEASLKSLKTPPRILHLATHGFYLPREGVASERPMALSGLALSGANRGMKGELSPSGEDGILYALEAQNLNLEGTELVALSACDTAQGVIDYSDGVYGLTRAFRIAGARQVLMTLWPVGDASARVFMLTFYRYWFGEGMRDAALALQKTRTDFLEHSYIPWRDSRVWAPFVLVGTR